MINENQIYSLAIHILNELKEEYKDDKEVLNAIAILKRQLLFASDEQVWALAKQVKAEAVRHLYTWIIGEHNTLLWNFEEILNELGDDMIKEVLLRAIYKDLNTLLGEKRFDTFVDYQKFKTKLYIFMIGNSKAMRGEL